MRFKKIFIIFPLIVYCLLVIGLNVQAGYEIEVSIPGGPSTGADVTLKQYIRYIYLLGLGLIGIAAFGALVYGGFMYMLSGTVTSKEEAKSWIKGAILGLVLGMTAYLILNTINPDLLRLKEPTLPPLSPPAASPSPSPPPASPLTCEAGNCDPGCEAAANCAEPTYIWDEGFCQCVYSGSVGP
jgi:hypothetical protein